MDYPPQGVSQQVLTLRLIRFLSNFIKRAPHIFSDKDIDFSAAVTKKERESRKSHMKSNNNKSIHPQDFKSILIDFDEVLKTPEEPETKNKTVNLARQKVLNFIEHLKGTMPKSADLIKTSLDYNSTLVFFFLFIFSAFSSGAI